MALHRALGPLLISLSLLSCDPSRPTAGTAHDDSSDRSCYQRYRDLYQNEELRIVVAFGYKDTRPSRFVGDRYERAELARLITQSCQSARSHLCGFKRSPNNMDEFSRALNLPWGKKAKVVLELLDSSVGPDDQSNRLNPFQRWKSHSTKERFDRALVDAEVLLYNGHSRAGGGPDFFPPKINSVGKVLYTEYREERRGFHAMLEVLSNSKDESRSQILGLFSCDSTQHFTEKLKKTRKDLALISSSSLIYFKDALDNTARTLDALLGLDCSENFKNQLRSKNEIQGSQIENFF